MILQVFLNKKWFLQKKTWQTIGQRKLMCEGEFIQGDENCCTFRGHCHYTGKYWGAVHPICNLRYKENSFIPLLAHNASAYDNRLMLIEITKKKQ